MIDLNFICKKLNVYIEINNSISDVGFSYNIFDNKHKFIGRINSVHLKDTNDLLSFIYNLLNETTLDSSCIDINTDKNYVCLLNDYPCDIVYQGLHFNCVTSAYEAQKAKSEIKKLFYTHLDATQSLQLSKINNLSDNRIQLNSTHIDIMHELLKDKFSNNKDCLSKLLFTKSNILVYNNSWHDNFWGICSCENCSDKNYNHLGRLLMSIRDEYLLNETKKENN